MRGRLCFAGPRLRGGSARLVPGRVLPLCAAALRRLLERTPGIKRNEKGIWWMPWH